MNNSVQVAAAASTTTATDGRLIISTMPSEKRVLRSVLGYEFYSADEIWKLSKDYSLNMAQVIKRTPPQHHYAVRKLMEHYATTFSAATTLKAAEALHGFFSSTSGEINTVQLINYRALFGSDRGHLTVLRPLFRRWRNFRYEGVSNDVVEMLDSWRVGGRRKGLAVKSLDRTKGPFSDVEYASFNEKIIFSYEAGEISLYDLCACLIISMTGRRPIQLTHLKCSDLISVLDSDDVTNYFLHIPRAKQEGAEFRDEFKTYQLTREMWELLDSHRQKLWHELDCLGYELPLTQKVLLPLFPAQRSWLKYPTRAAFIKALFGDQLHIRTSVLNNILKRTVESLGIVSDRTDDLLNVFARRFRYSLGTRAAREGMSKYVIAELLDHSDIQHVDVYTLNVPEHLKKIDEALGFQLAVYAQAFTGNLVGAELDALRGSDPSSRVKHNRCAVGTCGSYSYCGMNVPRPCYTCFSFQPWIDGPHEKLYIELLDERERIIAKTGSLSVASILDRTIFAVADVISKCAKRKEELADE
ncbi:site-specific integrase [Xanthomonas sp. WHRI 1810A]|uniref:site-specific integrase n=1 Tax=Xanthomonas sp. WHRI 1810A TaxID=3161565 RepID=UPI0032E89ACD